MKLKKSDVVMIAKIILATRDHAFLLPFEIEKQFGIKKDIVVKSASILREMGAINYSVMPWNSDRTKWDDVAEKIGIPKIKSSEEIKYNSNETGLFLIRRKKSDTKNEYRLLGKIAKSPEVIPTELLKKYSGSPDEKIRKIFFVEREVGTPRIAILNEDYDNPISVSVTKGAWKMLYEIAKGTFIESSVTNKKYIDYFNFNIKNKLYTASQFGLTTVLKAEDGYIVPAIEKIMCISERALKQRPTEETTT